MLCGLNDLDRGVLANPSGVVDGQWNLWQTEAPRIQLVGGACDLEDALHGKRVVGRAGAFAHVDVEECLGVAAEPSRLNAYGTAGDGPLGPVLRHGHAST